MKRLLAIDLGIKTGFALYNNKIELEWHRSQNFGNKNRLQRAVANILNQHSPLDYIVVEGGGSLFKIWEKEASKLHINCLQLHAYKWRNEILYGREQRTGIKAKEHSLHLAKQVIDYYGKHKPTSLNDDAAEAILTGFWALKEVGWLESLPHLKR